MARPVEHMEGFYTPPVHVLNPQYSIKDSIRDEIIEKVAFAVFITVLMAIIAVTLIGGYVMADWILYMIVRAML